MRRPAVVTGRPRSPRRAALAAAGALACAALVGVGVGAAPASADEDDYQCDALAQGQEREGEPVEGASEPMEELRIGAAAELVAKSTGKQPGEGVRVAVVDAGVATQADITTDDLGLTPEQRISEEFVGTRNVIEFYHGTAMAGIIAGKAIGDRGIGTIGIAPGAAIVDIPVYDTPQVDEDEETLKGLEIEGLVAGLQLLRDYVGPDEGQVQIVNVSITADAHVEALRQAISDLTDRGAIVVTSSGNRNFGDYTEAEPFEPGEDMAGRFFPAAYASDDPEGRWQANPRIVVAGSLIPEGFEEDPQTSLSSDIDVVVPTANAVTYGVTGDACRIVPPSTSVAAAEVSGVLAMLETAFPDAGPDELIRRLEVTAAGAFDENPDAPERFVGKGVVQPLEALTRRSLNGPSDGARRRPVIEPAVLPEAEPDVLAGTRGDAVWWGLAGGGALVVALILRPVLARRRREEF